MTRLRCAIYTRKSSEEGLEQDFNSLHAQREACAAYVASQASEGWTLNREEYDDGGISGGTLERPALKRLLVDIAAGKIDIVVVYKVDRLTRSLLDFSKLVEAFDQAGTSFVSITQSFNTTTSMGRLTLNMLLSFAQFEREVTAERIRDKIAASKARGMWMGGIPPTGYCKDGRTLAVVEAEAQCVRDVFARYLELGHVRALADELARQRITAPARTHGSGRQGGGRVLSRGQLYHMLRNPIYIGQIRHRDRTWPGLHAAIIDASTWDAVQARLADNRQGNQRQRSERPSLLSGLVRDEHGAPLVASHACKAARGSERGEASAGTTRAGKTGTSTVRYRYYVTQATRKLAQPGAPAIRLPAKELEAAVIDLVATALGDPIDLLARLGAPLDAAVLARASSAAARLADQVRTARPDTIRSLVKAVRVRTGEIEVELSVRALASAFGIDASDPAPLTLRAPARITRSGHSMRLIQTDRVRQPEKRPRDNLIRLLVRGRGWWERLAQGQIDIATIAREEGVTASYVTRVTRLAWLSPKIVEAILAGEQPAVLEAGLLRAPGMPARWAEQERLFLSA